MYLKIKQLRESKKLSQKKIYTAIGMDSSQYSRFESGRGKMSAKQLKIVAEILGTTVDLLISESDNLSELYVEETVSEIKILLQERSEWIKTKALLESVVQQQLQEIDRLKSELEAANKIRPLSTKKASN